MVMLYPTHLAVGLIIGKLSNNYIPALIGTFIVDVDHLLCYIRHNILFNFKEIWKTSTSQESPYNDQRTFMHSLITWVIITAAGTLIDLKAGMVFSVAYLAHILLDMVDGCGFYPFYPLKFKTAGPIRYSSKAELILMLLLYTLFFLL